jgi:alpha-tubulin suppressor-like RCC1 family protein
MRRRLPLVALVVALCATAPSAHAAPTPGSLLGFGDGGYGLFALGTFTSSKTPIELPMPAGTAPLVDVSVGDDHALALTGDGQVLSWGDNDRGQLGRPTMGIGPQPAGTVTLPAQTGPAVAVSAGGGSSLVLTATGQLYAFGSNDHGQLAVPVGTSYRQAPALVALPPEAAGKVVAITMGWSAQALAVTSDGALYGWGGDWWGQLGFAPPAGAPHTPNPNPQRIVAGDITATTKLVATAAGGPTTLALDDKGNVYGFGYNQNKQAGNDGGSPMNARPTIVVFPAPVIAEDPARRKATTNALPPIGLFSHPASAVAAGAYHGLMLVQGQVWSFGRNDSGELGRTTPTTSVAAPGLVVLPGTTSPVVQIAGGGFSSMALTAAGELFVWGSNSQGQLGNPGIPTSGTRTPTLAFLPAGTRPSLVDATAGSFNDSATTLALVGDLALGDALPAARAGERYDAAVPLSGGIEPVTLTKSGALPAGLSFDAASGRIAGTPTAGGTSALAFTAVDRYGQRATKSLSLAVAPPPSTAGPAPITTAPPSGSGTTPPVTAQSIGRTRIAKLTAIGGTLKVTLACTGGPCGGRLAVVSRAKPAKQAKAKKKAKTITYATKTYAIAAGRSSVVTITINRSGRAALKRARRLAVTVSLRPTGVAASTRGLTLKQPKAKKAKARAAHV